VTKKKDSVALFEVISKSRQKRGDSDLGVPGWIEPPEAPPQQAEAPPVPVRQAEAPPSPARQAAAIPQAPSRPVEPAIGVVGGRLMVSLNYVSCLVIAMGLLVLLVAAFWLGRATGGAARVEPTEAVGTGLNEGKSTGETIAGGDTRPPPGAEYQETTEVTRLPKRVSGKYYLVIESIKKNTDAASRKANRKEAERIIEFCKQKGEPSELRSMKGRFIVWSLTPHDSSGSEAALRHARFIQDNLGKEYFEKYKTYKFLHTKNGEFAPWYIRQP